VERTSDTARVLLRRAYGAQDTAFAASLPLGLVCPSTASCAAKSRTPCNGPHEFLHPTHQAGWNTGQACADEEGWEGSASGRAGCRGWTGRGGGMAAQGVHPLVLCGEYRMPVRCVCLRIFSFKAVRDHALSAASRAYRRLSLAAGRGPSAGPAGCRQWLRVSVPLVPVGCPEGSSGGVDGNWAERI
jgi:hypothetical protein